MSDLTQFRDHCRRMAEGKVFEYRNNAGEELSYTAGGAELYLWKRLADEVDSYLAIPALPSDEALDFA